MRTKRYVVTIEYREPTFERHAGIEPRPRRGTFVVFAETEEAAAVGGVYEFRRIEALSGVGWSRDVVSVSVFPRVIEGGRP